MAELIATEESSTPTTPSSGQWKGYFKSNGWYILEDNGREIGPLLAADGWIPGTGTWSYSSADSPTFVASVPDADAALIQVGDRIKLTQTTAKYFIVTAKGSPSGGNTPVTIYGGTDYTLANAAITIPFWSHTKSPLGFPMDPTKWTVKVTDSSNRNQASPTQNTWYNLGSVTISVPIGIWKVSYKVCLRGDINGTSTNCFSTLSTANNSESDAEFTLQIQAIGATATTFSVQNSVYTSKVLAVAAKTSYFLNSRTTVASMASIANRNDVVGLIIAAECAYL